MIQMLNMYREISKMIFEIISRDLLVIKLPLPRHFFRLLLISLNQDIIPTPFCFFEIRIFFREWRWET